MTPITPGPHHPSQPAAAAASAAAAAAAAAAPILTQCFHRNLPRQRRRQVDAHQIHVLVQQHVVDPVGVEWDVHFLGQLLRLLLRAAPQRFDGEAFVLQQRDDDPGSQAGAKHTDPWKHGSAFLPPTFTSCIYWHSSVWSGAAAAAGMDAAIHLQSDNRRAAFPHRTGYDSRYPNGCFPQRITLKQERGHQVCGVKKESNLKI